MKNFVDKIEYISPEMKVIVIDEDIITNSIVDDESGLDEVPLGPDQN